MLHLSMQDLQDRAAWAQAGIRLSRCNVATIRTRIWETPVRLRFGVGDILRGFLAAAQQILLSTGRVDTGILAAKSFDLQTVGQVYSPYDTLSLLVRMRADGSEEQEATASVAGGLKTDCAGPDWAGLTRMSCSPTLQMASFTITEKGHALTDLEKKPLSVMERGLAAEPGGPRHIMSVAAAPLYHRFQAGGAPIAMVSMDNRARNGKKFRAGVLSMTRGWVERGLAESAPLDWPEDGGRVSFPWSMTDKITPHPSERVQEGLGRLGVTDMAITRINTGILVAPFVNAEIAEYLVLEDVFPNGYPAPEGAGVYLTDRTVVEKAEEMKVGTCLDPLHTALTVYGCLLGYISITAEMGDADPKTLMGRIATESLPMVEDPDVLSPRAFIDEVLHERFPSSAIPDTPQRIAADTSQKLPVRYGDTLRRYARQSGRALAGLEFAPLVFAGWCCYLLGVDDRGSAVPVNPDPMLPQLQAHLKGIEVGWSDSLAGQPHPTLSNAALSGIDLYAASLGERTEEMFRDMLASPGAVRATLHHSCVCKQP